MRDGRLPGRRKMDSAMRETYGVSILCGGKSSRMGQDKALLQFRGERLADRMIREFSGCGEILISVRDEEQLADRGPLVSPAAKDLPAERCVRVKDTTAGVGPLAGIGASLEVCRSGLLFVTAVDMPFMDRVFADELLYQAGDAGKTADAVIPADDNGRLQPLCAFYRRSCLPSIRESIERREYRVRSWLKNVSVFTVPIQFLTEGKRKLTNVNDRMELNRL